DELRARLGEPMPAASKETPLLPHFAESRPATAEAPFTPFTEAAPRSLEDSEREMIRESLERNGGRRKATADELNISERTLYRKIREYGLE
ncbi:MAG: sigma-54-dependent Fis family transcriptional regulator, partial [Muribaculaceae bacterium]|nr:sigma-54-dependent Fis family transcriptional regulator [Muribaculaceae bacterium]